MRTSLWLTAVAAALTGSLAHAADPAVAASASAPARGQMVERFKTLDTNGDGKLSRAEVQAAPGLAGKFDDIDTNRDGEITPQELRAYHQAHRGGAAAAKGGALGPLSKLDANGDGYLSRDEVAGHPRLAADFDQLDTDHDGRLSPAELAALRKAR